MASWPPHYGFEVEDQGAGAVDGYFGGALRITNSSLGNSDHLAKIMQWQNRAHFFAVSAQLMRRILVEHARRQNLKRGGDVPHVSLDEAALAGDQSEWTADLVALDDAMNALAVLDPRKVQVVEMRFFGGLSVEETAEVLKVSSVTVKRDWRAARTWLYRELTGATNHGPQTLETS